MSRRPPKIARQLAAAQEQLTAQFGDKAHPTEWRGIGDATFHGYGIRYHRTLAEGFAGMSTSHEWVIGFTEAWPGCCSSFHRLGRGATFEEALEAALLRHDDLTNWRAR